MNLAKKIFLIVQLLLCVVLANAQVDTTQSVIKVHSPKKAAILSAVLPGLGQAYNKKYWKIPVIYAGMGACVYVVISNQKQFNDFKQAYIQRDNGEIDKYSGLSSQALINNMDNKRTIRDYALAGTVLIYALQIVEANVNAYLLDFDISDDLSARIIPQTINVKYSRTPAFGVCCTLKF